MISPDDYAFISGLLKKQSGLALGPGKEYLLESRLPSVAVTYGHDDIGALMNALRAIPSKQLVKHVCDAMTTNETMFFRDGKPFVTLEKELLPAAAKRAKALGRPVRLWCAASSTGQEPYTIAMIVAQMEARLAGVRVEITATDYSSAALARATAGIYNQFEVQRGLPVQLLMKYFTPHPDGFELSADIRRRVTYREINLLDPFPEAWEFDIIFCRNVLIYFDVPTKKDIIDRMAKILAPGGGLFLGGTESTLGITESVVRVTGNAGGLFCKPGDMPHHLAVAA
ncbi:MAG: CheR family methyltransferase [Gemmatimonas sp.]|jgi:chemotaxis protein methyltransferase CheR